MANEYRSTQNRLQSLLTQDSAERATQTRAQVLYSVASSAAATQTRIQVLVDTITPESSNASPFFFLASG